MAHFTAALYCRTMIYLSASSLIYVYNLQIINFSFHLSKICYDVINFLWAQEQFNNNVSANKVSNWGQKQTFECDLLLYIFSMFPVHYILFLFLENYVLWRCSHQNDAEVLHKWKLFLVFFDRALNCSLQMATQYLSNKTNLTVWRHCFVDQETKEHEQLQ